MFAAADVFVSIQHTRMACQLGVCIAGMRKLPMCPPPPPPSWRHSCAVLQEKQAAEVSQQGATDSPGIAAADEETRLQQQLQELTAKIADLDEGG